MVDNIGTSLAAFQAEALGETPLRFKDTENPTREELERARVEARQNHAAAAWLELAFEKYEEQRNKAISEPQFHLGEYVDAMESELEKKQKEEAESKNKNTPTPSR